MALERLQISANRRFLVTRSGQPFFWLGDTAWELFHRCSLEETEHYLETRRKQGFNVVQAVALAELDGLNTGNVYGDRPLLDNDPAQINEAYFRHVDAVIRLAADKGIYIALLPTWGDKINLRWGIGPVIFNVDNARVYGRILADRFRQETNLIWVLGGDRDEITDGVDYTPVWRAMAAGIREVLGREALMTYHPMGGRSSSMSFHQDDWLDMNMWQSGHLDLDIANWELIESDYNRLPVKPVIDGEPNYEDHPVNPYTRQWLPEYGYFDDYDVRKQAYRAVFAGACGHTYGHHSVWQMYTAERQPTTYPKFSWPEALERPGAAQMMHLKRLMLSRPYLTRIPAQDLLCSDPGSRATHIRATRDSEGGCALVYLPVAEQSVTVDVRALSGDVIQAWWYDPRSGAAADAGTFSRSEALSFTSPSSGPDWVLVLDDSARGFAAPGVV